MSMGPAMLSDSATKDVIVLRKTELLMDVLSAIDNANVPEGYAIKISVTNKLSDLIDEI